MKFQNKYQPNFLAICLREKSLLVKHYDFIKCSIRDNTLICKGFYQPIEDGVIYKYEIKYKPDKTPKVTVVEPKIIYNEDIHMYPSNCALWLYHRTDLVWSIRSHLFDTIIPWTHEWFVFYELYKITGKWEHPFVQHNVTEKKDL